ncbi:MAG: hypothetical protein HY264_07935 [Chloroflexi bacterium]|nr:hypothetical protein [Chloroflexota bacterium]
MSAEPRALATRRALVIAIVVVVLLVIGAAFVAGPAVAPSAPTFPPAGATTPPAGAAAAATRGDIAAALAAVGLQVEDIRAPYRPAESARLTTAPRVVIRAVIPNDPDHGRIVIYEFLSTADATAAANEQAVYLASGVGRVQFTPDTQFTVRVVGSTVVFYAWSAAGSPDATRAGAVATALATLGFAVPVSG